MRFLHWYCLFKLMPLSEKVKIIWTIIRVYAREKTFHLKICKLLIQKHKTWTDMLLSLFCCLLFVLLLMLRKSKSWKVCLRYVKSRLRTLPIFVFWGNCCKAQILSEPAEKKIKKKRSLSIGKSVVVPLFRSVLFRKKKHQIGSWRSLPPAFRKPVNNYRNVSDLGFAQQPSPTEQGREEFSKLYH